jgi:hypothetical protein
LQAYQLKEGILIHIKEKAKIRDGRKEITREKLGLNIEQCPCYKTGTMTKLLNFDANAPPIELLKKTNIKPKIQK